MTELFPERVLKRMSAADRKSVGQMTATEAVQRCEHRLEKQQQGIFASWCALHERAGELVYNWSRTDKRSTNRTGLPDFCVWSRGRCLFIELKAPGGRLSEEQELFRALLEAQGFTFVIARNAAGAIEAVKRHLFG